MPQQDAFARQWTEEDSRAFIDLADVAVAGRQEANEMLVSLIPATGDEEFRIVDLACGEGVFLEQVLDRFPMAHALGLDGSDLMRARAAARLRRFGERAGIAPLDLDGRGWLSDIPAPGRCITSSLALHHVAGEAKRSLYRELVPRLETGGALLVLDIVQPANDLVRRAFSAQWHSIAREQSEALTGSVATYEEAVREGWDANATAEPEPGEMPSQLYEQLRWLEEAGLSQVDCFWMRAGSAIYGGYR